MLKTIIESCEKKFGKAIIFIAFTFVSLISAVVLFGLMDSTGFMELAFPDYVKEAKFGGALTGFLATLLILIRETNKPDELTGQNLTLKGNVLDDDENPIRGAVVFVIGTDRKKYTDDMGYFAITVENQDEWDIRATWQNKSTTKTLKNNEINKPIILKFDEKKKV